LTSFDLINKQPMSKAVHSLIFDGFADWEPALALAELRRSGKLDVVTVGFTPEPATSMGGLRVLPDLTLDQVNLANVQLFMLPGGEMWESGDYPRDQLEPLLRELHHQSIPIAGICGATLALARAGLLNDRAHTSNFRDFLTKLAPEYFGGDHYCDALAVRDRGVITASGLGATEFAREVLAELGVFDDNIRELWFQTFKTGKFLLPSD
jgi:putative intracellular protease/amidase